MLYSHANLHIFWCRSRDHSSRLNCSGRVYSTCVRRNGKEKSQSHSSNHFDYVELISFDYLRMASQSLDDSVQLSDADADLKDFSTRVSLRAAGADTRCLLCTLDAPWLLPKCRSKDTLLGLALEKLLTPPPARYFCSTHYDAFILASKTASTPSAYPCVSCFSSLLVVLFREYSTVLYTAVYTRGSAIGLSWRPTDLRPKIGGQVHTSPWILLEFPNI